MLTRVQFLSRLLKLEFIYISKYEFEDGREEDNLRTNFQRGLDELSSLKVLEKVTDVDGNPCIKTFGADMKLWSDQFSFLCMLLWPFVESYWLAAVGFLPSANRNNASGAVGTQPRVFTESTYLKRLQKFAASLYFQGDLDHYEAISQENIRQACSRLSAMGVLTRQVVDSGSTMRSSSDITLALAPAYEDGKQLKKLLETIGQYRPIHSRLRNDALDGLLSDRAQNLSAMAKL